jgi:hypothetical protein
MNMEIARKSSTAGSQSGERFAFTLQFLPQSDQGPRASRQQHSPSFGGGSARRGAAFPPLFA